MGEVVPAYVHLGELNLPGPVHVPVVRAVDPLGDGLRSLHVGVGARGVAPLELHLGQAE